MKDCQLKQQRAQIINASKYRIPANIQIDDSALLRDHTRPTKFSPLFDSQPHKVIDVIDEGRKIVLQRCSEEKQFIRHPADIKLKYSEANQHSQHFLPSKTEENNGILGYNYPEDYDWDNDSIVFDNSYMHNNKQNEPLEVPSNIIDDHIPTRISTRPHVPNRRYYNENVVNYYNCCGDIEN